MYQELLDNFAKLPKKKANDETFISICGHPHYEKVASNILAFFFDTKREHNLKDLFVKSLIEAAGENAEDFSDNFSSETEVYTNKGNYIDLLLRSEERNIVVENKIYAWLYNDLDDYYETVSEKEKEKPLGIVLSLHQQEKSNPNFKVVRYEDFFAQIKTNLGLYIQSANRKYMPFLLDFIDNIENLNRRTNMDKDFIEFMRDEDNEYEAIELSKRIDGLRNELRNKVNLVIQKLRQNPLLQEKIKNEKLKIWAWRDSSRISDDVVVDYFPDANRGVDISFDSVIDLNRWIFFLWIRFNKTGSVVKLEDYIKRIGQKGKEENGRFYLQKTFDFDANVDEVAEFIASVVSKL